MVYDCWRGMVGIIKPTKGSGSLVELIKLLPEGIGVIPLFNHVRHGTIEEFQGAIPAYEEKIAELAQDKVDLIHPAGTPPFMLLGYKGEAEMIAKWEKRFGIPVFTSGTNQIAAMKALGIRKFVGIGYDFEDTSIVARYFTDAGSAFCHWKSCPGRGKKSEDSHRRTFITRRETCFCAMATRMAFIFRAVNFASSISSSRSSRTSASRLFIPAWRNVGKFKSGCMCDSRLQGTAAY